MSLADIATESDVTAAAAGDRAAFGRLIEGSSSLVCSIALSIVRDLDLSRDVAQDVYIAAWRDLARLRNRASFLPWLRQLTRNKAHEAVRGRLRYEKRVEPADEETLKAAADPTADVVARVISREEQRALADAIGELPGSCRDVVILFYQEDRSVRHVAELLGISEAAVKQRLSRAREVLRGKLLASDELFASKVKPSTFAATILGLLPLGQPKFATAAMVAAMGSKALATALVAAGMFAALYRLESPQGMNTSLLAPFPGAATRPTSPQLARGDAVRVKHQPGPQSFAELDNAITQGNCPAVLNALDGLRAHPEFGSPTWRKHDVQPMLQCLWAVDSDDAMERFLTDALHVDPGNSIAARELAWFLKQQGRFSEAVDVLDSAMGIEVTPTLLGNRALIQLAMVLAGAAPENQRDRMWNESGSDLLRAVELDPAVGPPAYDVAVSLLMDSNEDSKGAALLERILNTMLVHPHGIGLSPSELAPMYLKLSQLLAKNGQVAVGLAYADHALTLPLDVEQRERIESERQTLLDALK